MRSVSRGIDALLCKDFDVHRKDFESIYLF